MPIVLGDVLRVAQCVDTALLGRASEAARLRAARANRAGVTAYLLYNGSATYIQ